MDLKSILPAKNIYADVQLPGSKSYSHRYLVGAALAGGVTLLRNMLAAQDINATIGVLRALNVPVTVEKNIMAVYGHGGQLRPLGPLLVGDSGTTARFALALAALCGENCIVDGSERMRERPMEDMLNALRDLGCDVDASPSQGLPVTIKGKSPKTNSITLNCGKSSQYLSALLMIAPLFPRGLTITVAGGNLVSKPYVNLTLAVMRAFGIKVDAKEAEYSVPGDQKYQPGDYTVEVDVSQASYFWAAAAIAKGAVLVRDTSLNTSQGDIVFVELLAEMGCEVSHITEGLEVSSYGPLKPVNADLSQTPDIVPTLAVVAAFAEGESVLRNVENLQYKECDRLNAILCGLGSMGINARFEDNNLYIEGGMPHGAVINTFNDHRMAMSFAVAGLGVENQVIENPGCVAKSFPNFWDVFAGMTEKTQRNEI